MRLQLRLFLKHLAQSNDLKIFAFFLPSFSGGCPQVSKKADLTRFPRRRPTFLRVKARKALPPDLLPILTGWPFTKNVELHLISSGAAPPPAAPPKTAAPTRPPQPAQKKKTKKFKI